MKSARRSGSASSPATSPPRAGGGPAAARSGSRLTPSPKQAPSAARVGAWRTEMSADDREEFEAVAGKLLAELGYDV